MRSRHSCLLVVALVAAAAAPAHAQLVVSPHLDAKVAGDVETERGGIGLSVGYYLRGLYGLGFEIDAAWHGHFFRDEDLVDLVPERVDLNTDALLLMGNLVLPVSIPRAPIWRPYATAGLGVTRALFDAQGADEYDTDQNDLTLNAGVGMMHQLTRLVGLRVDARYYHAFVDEDADKGGYFKDYGFWNIAVGVTFGFPAGP
jgi:opacity protein-like surface antigen